MNILGNCYFKLSNAVFCYGLTPIQLAVYAYLVSRAGQKEKCWPSIKTIAACCSCSKNAARDAVKVLDERGFIHKVDTYRHESTGITRQTNNTYYILELPPLSKPEPIVAYQETEISDVIEPDQRKVG
jgi:DNA-binding MarR family transcriptional regulator